MDRSRVTQITADLVRIESINPVLVPGGGGEEKIARYVTAFLERAGLRSELQPVGPGRFNAVGILKGSGGGRSLMLNGHLDTVGVSGMNEPFSARVEDGGLYGRGAQDMKGGIAAALAAVEILARGERLKGDVVVAAVADEEHESAGIRALLGNVRTDAAIVMEPTALEIVTAHKGFAWAEVVTLGRAAHGSRPEEGVDAIALMGRVLGEIENLADILIAQPAHPLLGHGSVHASLISGGQELSSYPAECRLTLERRLLPGESAATLAGEIGAMVAKLSRADSRFRGRFDAGYSAAALETAQDASIAQTLAQCARPIVGSRARFGAQSFWTDGALLSGAGIPSVLFGPGGAGLHSAVEYVDLEDVALCAETLVECTRAFCGT